VLIKTFYTQIDNKCLVYRNNTDFVQTLFNILLESSYNSTKLIDVFKNKFSNFELPCLSLILHPLVEKEIREMKIREINNILPNLLTSELIDIEEQVKNMFNLTKTKTNTVQTKTNTLKSSTSATPELIAATPATPELIAVEHFEDFEEEPVVVEVVEPVIEVKVKVKEEPVKVKIKPQVVKKVKKVVKPETDFEFNQEEFEFNEQSPELTKKELENFVDDLPTSAEIENFDNLDFDFDIED